jgi:membrane protease YdiL (CAAX protease family)
VLAGLKRHPLILFFLLTYLFSWTVWGTSIAQANGKLSFHIPQMLAFWGLIFATYIAAAVTGGWTAVKETFSRVYRWKIDFKWYGVAIFLTLVLGFVTLFLFSLSSGKHQIGRDLSFQGFLVFSLTETIFMIFTEETAWRGFALPRLQVDHSALSASLILGLLWGLWHIPLFLIPGNVQQSYPFIGFILLILPTSVLFTWIFNHTRGSVLLTGLFHGLYDATIVYLGILTGDVRLFWFFVVISWTFAIGVARFEGAAHLTYEWESGETTVRLEPVSPQS